MEEKKGFVFEFFHGMLERSVEHKLGHIQQVIEPQFPSV